MFEQFEIEDSLIIGNCNSMEMKGIVIVNGFNLGRYYNVGPTFSLYVPGSLLKKGKNQIIIFETEGIVSNSISLIEKPIFKNDMENN